MTFEIKRYNRPSSPICNIPSIIMYKSYNSSLSKFGQNYQLLLKKEKRVKEELYFLALIKGYRLNNN